MANSLFKGRSCESGLMGRFRRQRSLRALGLVALLTALLVGSGLVGPSSSHARNAEPAPAAPVILSAADVAAYSAAFSAVRRGEFQVADMMLEHVENPCLTGYVAMERVLSPVFLATSADLKAWMGAYPDLAGGDRVAALIAGASKAGEVSQEPPLSLAARTAYSKGRFEEAERLALRENDGWTLGLLAFRRSAFADAFKAFSDLANALPKATAPRAAAAFWAARSAERSGRPGDEQAYLKAAAQAPFSFYGQLALRRLGDDNALNLESDQLSLSEPAHAAPSLSSSTRPRDRTSGNGAPSLAATDIWLHQDLRAQRTAALLQLGQIGHASDEIRHAMAIEADPALREKWQALAKLLPQETLPEDLPDGARFRPENYPTPELNPEGGFTVDKALVYAIVKRESRFNPKARGGAAFGLMQLTAETAAAITGDRAYRRKPKALQSGGLNLKLGQIYLAKLLALNHGDLIQTLAAYNVGPRIVGETRTALASTDSLLILESLPGAGVRDFVRHVAADTWIYSRLFGASPNSLDTVAKGMDGWTTAALSAPAH